MRTLTKTVALLLLAFGFGVVASRPAVAQSRSLVDVGVAYNYVRSNLRLYYKAGNNSDPDTDVNGYLSICGLFSIPHRVNGANVTKVYTFGMWINKATVNTANIGTQASLLIRAATREARCDAAD